MQSISWTSEGGISFSGIVRIYRYLEYANQNTTLDRRKRRVLTFIRNYMR